MQILAPKEKRRGFSDWMPNWVQDHSIYFRKLLDSGSAIASLVPSSRWAARGMLKGINFRNPATILELGAGTGPITSELLLANDGGGRSLIVERDPDFCCLLRKRFPQAEIIEGDALAVNRILDQRGIAQVDHVLCELPLGWLQPAERDAFLQAICQRLAPGGSFRQLTHLPGLHRSMYGQYFHEIRTHVVPWNLPPAGCYICEGPRLTVPCATVVL